MIIARSPLRITFGGGGTDLPSYYTDHEGFLVAAAIDKYVYVTAMRPFTPGIFLKYNSSSHLLAASIRFRWEYVPGSELFVVYSDNRDTLAAGYPALTNRTFAVKITRLVRF